MREQSDPCPPPRVEDEANDPRRVAYIEWLGRMFDAQPEQAAMHLWDADATLEDTEVLGLEFSAQQMTWPVYGYHAWWREGDMRSTFAYHARVARLLQSHRPPNRWLFKAPHHKFHLAPIVEAYPDIRFIFTHRDPGKSVPSYASFVAALYPPYVRDRIGKEKIGREIHNHLLTGMRQAVAARELLGPERFLDVRSPRRSSSSRSLSPGTDLRLAWPADNRSWCAPSSKVGWRRITTAHMGPIATPQKSTACRLTGSVPITISTSAPSASNTKLRSDTHE